MKITLLLVAAMAAMVHGAKRPAAAAAAAATSKAAAPAATPATPKLSPQQSNPPDPGNAFQPRTQSGCLSNIGIGYPTANVYYHPGDSMTFTIRADMFLPESNTGAEIVDNNNNTIATVIPTFPTLNYTTISSTIPLPTQATPGTYFLRFQQTYSNTFASAMRSQTMQIQMIVVSPGASTPAPPVTTTVNPLGLTLTVPPVAATAVPAAGGSSVPAAASGGVNGTSVPATGANATGTGAAPATTGSSASGIFDSFGFIIAVVLGLVGILASL